MPIYDVPFPLFLCQYIQSFLAFDASPVSDYPEEQEYLVASAYVRVMGIETRPMHKTWDSFQGMEDDYITIQHMSSAPRVRSIFYAVHLFLEQIFSMSTHLEFWVTGFLHILCVPSDAGADANNSSTRPTSISDRNELKYPVQFREKLVRAIDLERTVPYYFRDEKEYRILNILHQKLQNFLKEPNPQQCLKLDVISEHLKPYFLDADGVSLNGGVRYVVSIKRIMEMFTNLKTIQFRNLYLFDLKALSKLVVYLEQNRDSTLRTVKFLYYQYTSSGQPGDENAFMNPGLLKQDEDGKELFHRLRKLQWNMEHDPIEGGIGYQIKLHRRFTKGVQPKLYQ